MLWNNLRDDTVTVKLNGDTFHFKPNSNKEIKTDGVTIRFYEETFREKQQKNKQSTDTKNPATASVAPMSAMPKQAIEAPIQSMPSSMSEEVSPAPNRATKQQTIEKMFAMGVDDLALKLNRLQAEREKNRKIIEEYAKTEQEMMDFLQQMLKKEWYLNRDIAEPILMKYEVHPEQKVYQQNLSSPKAMVEALFYCQHCHRADIKEMMAEVRKAKQENWSLGKAIEELQKTQEQLQQEREKEKEKMQQILTDFKEKYSSLQEELKQKMREVTQVKQQNEVLQAQTTEKTEESIVIEETLEDISLNSELEEINIPAHAFMEEAEPKAEFKLQSRQQLRQPIRHQSKEIKQELEEENTESLFDFSFLENTGEVNDVQQEMPYVRLLKEKGYAVEPAVSHQYDWMVAGSTEEKIPLMYIYYDIEKADEFDSLMKDTNKMYFVFDSKKRMFKGNTKFTSWLLKQKERKFDIQFSFTTVDQLKVAGLSALDKM